MNRGGHDSHATFNNPQRAGIRARGARAHALATPGVIITEEPQSAAVASGSGVAFSVAVGVQGKIITSYQRRRNGDLVFRDTQTAERST